MKKRVAGGSVISFWHIEGSRNMVEEVGSFNDYRLLYYSGNVVSQYNGKSSVKSPHLEHGNP